MSATIRLASPTDARGIQAIYAPIVRETHISFETTVPSVAKIANRINKTLRQYPWLICAVGGQTAGYAYASAFRSRPAYQWTAETTVYIHPDYQRRGIARALYRSLLAILREQGYCSAVGVIALPNAGSVRAHESLGFRKIGLLENVGYKQGEWRDTGWWQLELQPPAASPHPPRAIQQLAAETDFPRLLATGLASVKR